MAFETPTAILIRRLAMQKPELFKDIFSHASKTPTLAQYNPLFMTFEAVNGEIILTGNNTIPLIRYAVGDHGGVLDFTEMNSIFKRHHIDLKSEAEKAGIANITELPFVYVYERNDFSTTLYGLQIYPETVREVLLEKPISDYLTGKCTLITQFSKKHDQFLEVNLELRKGKKIDPRMKKIILNRIITNLRLKNSEFRELSNYLKKTRGASAHLLAR
jgi:phenylacetate-CoA ligase